METIDLEKIQVILEMFVDKTSGLTLPHTIPAIKTKLTGPMAIVANVPGIILELYSLGILTSDSHVVLNNRIFYITPKGLSVLNTEGGIKKFYKDQAAKEDLEQKILKQTNHSFKLNTIQFIITAILALGTIGSLIIQWRTFEMEKVKTDLEIKDLKSRLDSVGKPIIKSN